jgi:hypothetical protein
MRMDGSSLGAIHPSLLFEFIDGGFLQWGFASPSERHHLLSFTFWSSSLRYASLHCVPSPTVQERDVQLCR